MPLPIAIFDQAQYLHSHRAPPHLSLEQQKDYAYSVEFLKSYAGRIGTFNSYRREVERLIQWTWLIEKKSLLDLKRQDIENYIQFWAWFKKYGF